LSGIFAAAVIAAAPSAKAQIQTTGTPGSPSATTTIDGKQNPERNVYFGEQHVHTSWSFDAFAFGDTVTDLKQKGAVALDDAQLKALVVGKTVTVTNTVTGQRFDILYGVGGRRLVTAANGKPSGLTEAGGELMHAGDVQYEIRDGRLVTNIDGTEFEVTVYKLGDKYIAARSNEFGYANYEVGW
jgi:hypothetical protein